MKRNGNGRMFVTQNTITLPSGRVIQRYCDKNHTADDFLKDLGLEILLGNVNLSNGKPANMTSRDEIIYMKINGFRGRYTELLPGVWRKVNDDLSVEWKPKDTMEMKEGWEEIRGMMRRAEAVYGNNGY